jgi:hypothetical protein
MHPDRSNYEVWLSDWLDGKLTGMQSDQFRSFLDQNPDLKEEAEFLSISHLVPANNTYPGKDRLKKTAAELPASQVEYLSVAYLENDLTPGQLDDLKQNIDHNMESRELFNVIQKIKLIPPTGEYRYKNRLKKQSTGAKILLVSLIGLSAAATIALVILSHIHVPGLQPDKKDISELFNDPSDEPFTVNAQVIRAPAEEFPEPETVINTIESTVPQTALFRTDDPAVLAVAADSSVKSRIVMPGFRIDTFPDFSFDLKTEISEYSLAVSTIEIKKILYEDERNKLSKFIARTFREKILKEETGSDAPVKPYEIVAAGIDGLNRLFGWDMALVRVNNEAGDLKSIYFSSRILKFNAPVRKTASAE